MFFIKRNAQRTYFRELRKKLSLSEQKIASINISIMAFYYEIFSLSKNIAVFFSFDGEISTNELILKLWKKKYNVFLPIVCQDFNIPLLFAQYYPNTRLKLNNFNIFEPVINKEVVLSYKDMDIIFVPLVAFDRFGYRLGMGGGFYDRILNNWKNKGFFPIGLAYSFQLTNEITPGPWESPLPVILTPNKLWRWNVNIF
ncbi:MAG: 5-formyltetrahydrofolate cyclo-ligase [Buchnera aphidicola (Floraphis choui)]